MVSCSLPLAISRHAPPIESVTLGFQTIATHTLPLRGAGARRFTAPMSELCDVYRYSLSNPMAAVLPRRCLPLVTRIVLVLEI
jgi:hypothetical protein